MAEQAGSQADPLTTTADDATAALPAAAGGDDALIARLVAEPWAFDFHQAMRRLEAARPDLPRIGASLRASQDPVRLGQDPSLAFAPAEILSVTPRPGGGPPRVGVAFFGPMGPNGALPFHITAYVRDRLANKDATLLHFLDLITHRLLTLFHRAWVVSRKTASYDRPHADRFAAYFASAAGLGQPSLQDRDRIPDAAKAFYTGRLAPQVRSAAGLRDVLADFLGVAVDVRQFIGQWVDLPPECRCRLGQSPTTGQLGRTLVVGSRMWDCQMKFRVRLGPLSLADFERFLPGKPGLRRVHDWINLYTNRELDWDVQLVLRRDQVPKLRLGASARLGWTTWVGTRTSPDDADDVVLSSDVAAASAN